MGFIDKVYQQFPLVNALLVYFFFSIAEEFQDVYAEGMHTYIIKAGYMNIIDWCGLLTCLGVFVDCLAYYGNQNGLKGIRAPYPAVAALLDLQRTCGYAMFFVIIKSLKFTKTIPVMCSIGNCFAHVMVPITLFAVVIVILQFAFASLGNLAFCTSLVQFDTISASSFSMFRGLLGDVDVDGFLDVDSVFGSWFFVVYVFVVLWVCMTMLIAIVSVSYDSVQDIPPQEGTAGLVCGWVKRVVLSVVSKDHAANEVDSSDGDSEPGEMAQALQLLAMQSQALERLQDQMSRMEQRMAHMQGHQGPVDAEDLEQSKGLKESSPRWQVPASLGHDTAGQDRKASHSGGDDLSEMSEDEREDSMHSNIGRVYHQHRLKESDRHTKTGYSGRRFKELDGYYSEDDKVGYVEDILTSGSIEKIIHL